MWYNNYKWRFKIMPINPESKRYFESMEEKIRSNPITFNEFAIYCKSLEEAAKN